MTSFIILAHGGGEGFWQMFFQWPPLHPILVNLTAGLIPAAIGFDLLARLTRKPSLASAGFWMTMLAAVVTPFTALAGWMWMNEMGDMGAAQAMAVHKWTGTIFAGLFVLLALWRMVEARRAAAVMPAGAPTRAEETLSRRPGPGPAYLSVAILLVFALIFQGHLGGMMSFGGESADTESQHEDTDHREQSGHATTREAEPTDSGWQRGIRVGDSTSQQPATMPSTGDHHHGG